MSLTQGAQAESLNIQTILPLLGQTLPRLNERKLTDNLRQFYVTS